MQFWIVIGLILVLSALGLTYEIAAGRVLAPFFGTSLLTWTTVIAVVLAGFSLGSALGGLVAERERQVAARAVRKALPALSPFPLSARLPLLPAAALLRYYAFPWSREKHRARVTRAIGQPRGCHQEPWPPWLWPPC